MRLKLVDYMDPAAIFISDEIGINKPNPKLYKTALSALGLEAREAMYVGDNIESDIIPPKSLGMITVWARLAGGRHAMRELPTGDIAPDHVIESFEALRALLRESYAIAV